MADMKKPGLAVLIGGLHEGHSEPDSDDQGDYTALGKDLREAIEGKDDSAISAAIRALIDAHEADRDADDSKDAG